MRAGQNAGWVQPASSPQVVSRLLGSASESLPVSFSCSYPCPFKLARTQGQPHQPCCQPLCARNRKRRGQAIHFPVHFQASDPLVAARAAECGDSYLISHPEAPARTARTALPRLPWFAPDLLRRKQPTENLSKQGRKSFRTARTACACVRAQPRLHRLVARAPPWPSSSCGAGPPADEHDWSLHNKPRPSNGILRHTPQDTRDTGRGPEPRRTHRPAGCRDGSRDGENRARQHGQNGPSGLISPKNAHTTTRHLPRTLEAAVPSRNE